MIRRALELLGMGVLTVVFFVTAPLWWFALWLFVRGYERTTAPSYIPVSLVRRARIDSILAEVTRRAQERR